MRRHAILAQARVELLLTLRRGESLLATLGIPVGVLVFFDAVDVVETGFDEPIDFLVPGVLALAVIATAMVSLGIATGFERRYGVLKLLGATPLGRSGLIVAKTLAVLAVQALQMVVLLPVAALLGWQVPSALVPAGLVLLVGTIAFAGLGLLMAGRLRAEGTLGLANLLYVAFILVGGVAVPLTELPSAVESVAKLTPAAGLAEAVRGVLVAGVDTPGWAWVNLAVWTVVAPLAAAVSFRWEE